MDRRSFLRRATAAPIAAIVALNIDEFTPQVMAVDDDLFDLVTAEPGTLKHFGQEALRRMCQQLKGHSFTFEPEAHKLGEGHNTHQLSVDMYKGMALEEGDVLDHAVKNLVERIKYEKFTTFGSLALPNMVEGVSIEIGRAHV